MIKEKRNLARFCQGGEIKHQVVKCVFVHGWGMNRAIWQPVVQALPSWIEPVCIDLPGHGQAAQSGFNQLDDLLASLESVDVESAIWVGWSLGGLAVTRLAQMHPEKVAAMMLVSNSPCFVARDDWTSAMPASVFDQFGAALAEDFSGTIRRFLSLQVKGSAAGRDILRTLRKQVLDQPAANPQALAAGLAVLKQTDLRDQLIDIQVPTRWVLGGQDGLVSADLGQQLQQLMPQAEIHVYDKAAHAPFLSHLPAFTEQLVDFIQRQDDFAP